MSDFRRQCQEAVDAIVCLPNVHAEIVGVWCWAWGDGIRQYDTYLRSLGWIYSNSKQRYCWHPREVEYQGKRFDNYRQIQETFGVDLHIEGGESLGETESFGRNRR